MNKTDKLINFLVRCHSEKPYNISIYKSVANPNGETLFKSTNEYTDNFKRCLELKEQGLVKIRYEQFGKRASMSPTPTALKQIGL